MCIRDRSSIEQVAYDGVSIAKKGDSILVSVNHRLNILGYLDLSPFGEKYKNSANAGHADMVAALQWVHAVSYTHLSRFVLKIKRCCTRRMKKFQRCWNGRCV